MSARVVRLCVHSVVHVCLYLVPRVVYTVAVRVPVTLYERVCGVPAHATRWARERAVRVVASATCDAAQRRALLHRLGLDTAASATYTAPLYGGHVQTLLGASRLGRRVAYTRETISATDGNPICLDWLRVSGDDANTGGAARVKGVLLVVPGLGNYGQTPYIQCLARTAVRRGYDCCVLTPRGMGSAPLTTPNIFCACFTADTHAVLRTRLHAARLAAEYGAPVPVFAIGYSLGCNMLIRCLAEEDDQRREQQQQQQQRGDKQQQRASEAQGMTSATVPAAPSVACCVCVNGPYDMVKATDSMLRGMTKLLYEKHMRSILYNYVRKNAHVLVKGLPRFVNEPQRFVEYCRRLRHVRDYDEVMTAPHFGYANAAAYYADANALQWLRHVTSVPVVCLAAAHDPLVGPALPTQEWQALADERPNVVYVQTPTGGHLGCVLDPCSEWRGRTTYLQTFPLDIFDSIVATDANATAVDAHKQV